MTAFGIGLIAGIALVAYARIIGLTREPGFYPTLLGAIASYYVVFAIDGTTTPLNLILHIGVFLAFIALATAGYLIWYWFTCLGLVLHAGLDLFIHQTPADPSPDWWGLFCLSLDLVLAVSMIWFRPDDRKQKMQERSDA